MFGAILSIQEVVGLDAERLNEPTTGCEARGGRRLVEANIRRFLWVESAVHLIELKGIPSREQQGWVRS